MTRPARFETHRFLGDKRSQIVYDLDAPDLDKARLDDLLSAQTYVTFGPDNLAEARNRGYRLWKGHSERNP
jgi:hypothetical protein